MRLKSKLGDTFVSLKHRDFRYFLSGQLLSLMGTMIQNTALSWYIYKMTNSPFLLGLIGVFQYAPVLLITLIGGVIAERHSKKKILMATQFSYMVQAFILSLTVYIGSDKYWIFAALAAVNGTITSLDMPTRQSFFIELVGKKDLPNAISLNSTVFNISRIVGPAFAGIIMNTLGVFQCFLLNAISFIPIIYGVFKIKAEGNPTEFIDKNSGVFRELKNGIIYTINRKILMSTMFMMAIVCTFAFNSNVIIPVFAEQVMSGGVSEYSFLLSLIGIGSLLGAMFMANKGRRLKVHHYLIVNSFILGVLHITTVFTFNYIAVACLFIAIGFFSLTFLNRANAVLQFNTEDGYRGRVMSIYSLLNMGSTPIGNAFAGIIMENFGGKFGFFSCGLIILSLTSIVLYYIKSKGNHV
ncbi:MAG: MFS transporter [Clostridium sp.]|jgi:MFS family permease|uniref:MFS transporter n=1 Tax=Clostridium sp. TaxID=1506 RepID=UPI0025B8D0EA|nr:MFS transporter [Clostridium sp.]MCH3965261.1 MFS transporter [Clostridium sp.]MCI1714481.1 MFS transporter [Clostridium sp.]MCI1798743.1 MFS transporter [Clostridium sp.]MCI1812526.1 MFS transporter [Clostridium sp.]MCI1869553.1 MFS transporter [Clostridium sp.]